jgi:hypothetical protein
LRKLLHMCIIVMTTKTYMPVLKAMRMFSFMSMDLEALVKLGFHKV